MSLSYLVQLKMNMLCEWLDFLKSTHVGLALSQVDFLLEFHTTRTPFPSQFCIQSCLLVFLSYLVLEF
jgi:hypothetical protein